VNLPWRRGGRNGAGLGRRISEFVKKGLGMGVKRGKTIKLGLSVTGKWQIRLHRAAVAEANKLLAVGRRMPGGR